MSLFSLYMSESDMHRHDNYGKIQALPCLCQVWPSCDHVCLGHTSDLALYDMIIPGPDMIKPDFK